jgi:PAS domain S-box-containing protein
VRSYAHPVWDEAEDRLVGIYGAVQDITERKQIEEALRASEEKFAKAFRASPDAISISTLSEDSHFIDVNEGLLRVSGYTREEVLHRPIRELNLWPDLEEREQIVQQLRQNGRVVNEEVILLTKRGEQRYFLLSAERIEIGGEPHAVFVARDITERKQMAQELERERLLLRTVIDTMPDYIYLKDTESRCLVSNVANARALGARSPEEVEGKMLSEFYPLAEAEIYNAKDRKVIATGKPLLNEENSFIDLESGQQRWTWMSRIPFRASDGRIVGVVGMSRDITDYKESLLEQDRLIAELQAKNAELERFTYTVSHDLKSPLVTIAGFLGYLEKDALSGNMDRLRQDIGKIQEAAKQMKRLLEDLLELSRIGRLVNPPTEVPFADILHEALDMMSIQVVELKIEVVYPPDFPVVRVDRLRLIEVMQNLLENAVKFMGSQPQPRLEIGMRQPTEGDEMIFFVKDNGIGIDTHYHETVFGLFHRLNPEIEGTGIGLALVKRIIETHGGRIWIESAGEGQGTTFCFTLPGEALA